MSESDRTKNLRAFVLAVLGLTLLLILSAFSASLGLASGPAFAASLAMSVVFVVVPILALYKGSDYPWTPKLGLAFLGFGVALHLGGVVLSGLAGPGVAGVVLRALGQTGLMVWTVGLGALLASLIRDKNLLLPVGLFLAGFDMFIVFTPSTFVSSVARNNQQVLSQLAYTTPAIQTAPEPEAPAGLAIQAFAYIGPADFFFMAMFFVALFRFGMRTQATLRWMIPVLVLYLGLVLWSPSIGSLDLGAMPALLPIGLVLLFVNLREFKLSGQEKASTFVVGLIALALAAYGAYRGITAPIELPAREPEVGVPAGKALPGSPAPVLPGPPQ